MKTMIRKFRILIATLFALVPLAVATPAQAAGIAPSGGGSVVVGQSFTVRVVASGAEFDSLQGTISVSGPVTVSSFAAGGATWLPGKSPGNGTQFVGIVSPTKSLTVATITLKATKEGKGSVTVSGVKLARNGSYVGDSGGSTSFTVGRAPTPPGGVSVSSTTHPDQNVAYEATTVELQWAAPSNGANGYSYVFDEVADTTPPQEIKTKDTSLKIEGVTVATHYFHIRANNNDGWGATTHFKITVKEPDAKVDPTLMAPQITDVSKSNDFTTDLKSGTVRGFTVSGTGMTAGYVLVLGVEPKDRLPKELLAPLQPKADNAETGATTATTTESEPVRTPLTADPNADGTWSVTVDHPIPSGFYYLVAAGQKEKVLTPPSETAYLELSVAKGGSVKLITEDDLPKPDLTVNILGITFKTSRNMWALIGGVVALVIVSIGLAYILRQYYKRLKNRPGKSRATAPVNNLAGTSPAAEKAASKRFWRG